MSIADWEWMFRFGMMRSSSTLEGFHRGIAAPRCTTLAGLMDDLVGSSTQGASANLGWGMQRFQRWKKRFSSW
jgi:hypothetical protein